MNKKQYNNGKLQARETAIEWQKDFSNHNYSYDELIVFKNHFLKTAKRYGLIREFKENGII